MQPENLPEFLEATYALELDDETWLKGVSAATGRVWGRPGGTWSAFHDASDLANFRPTLVVADGVSTELAAALYRTLRFMTPALTERLYRRFTAGTMRQEGPEMGSMLAETEALGVVDAFGLFGSDPSGLGCSISITMSAPQDLGRDELSVYQRMAFHLGAAFRCRIGLRARANPHASVDLSVGAEAVFDTGGRMLHAEGSANKPAARESLKAALRRFERARARGRGTDPIAGIKHHRPLVDARWTLMDSHARGGARSVVARENQAAVRGLAGLTERERQVVAFLALGRSTKEIAYTLGISDSTTRVLLARAATRMGVRTREELVRVVTRQALPGLDTAGGG